MQNTKKPGNLLFKGNPAISIETRGFPSLAVARFALYVWLGWGNGGGFNAEKYLTSALGQ